MKKTINREVFFAEMSELMALYERRMAHDPENKHDYECYIAAVRAVMARVDSI